MSFDPDQGHTGFGARLFRLRFYRLQLTQAKFAHRFGLSLGAVKDWEQGRTAPTRAMLVLVAAIQSAPATMARAADRVRDELEMRRVPPCAHRWRTDRTRLIARKATLMRDATIV